MQMKSTRGVQQEEVWAAADNLVAEGLRPTIERVRQKMGRGSPNTVSPMLDAWFGRLGARLGVTEDKKSAVGELPTPVRQAVNKLWDAAVLAAKSVAEQDLLQAQQALVAECATMKQLEVDLANREQGLKTRQTALDEVLQDARRQISDLNTRLEQSQSLTNRRDEEIQLLQSKLSEQDKQRRSDQLRSEEEFRRHAEERQQLQEHATSAERRLMLELDRERQETKRVVSKLNEIERRAETIDKKFQEDKQGLIQKLLKVETDLRSERQSLLLTTERAGELRALLDEQRTVNGNLVAQLNHHLTELNHQSPITDKLRRRVYGKAFKNRKLP